MVIPRVHWAYTGERVNVQDFIDGIPGDDLARVDREGLDRKLLARRGARAVLKMIVEDGFFHADPHPGNVFYLPGNRVAFIDFGMVGPPLDAAPRGTAAAAAGPGRAAAAGGGRRADWTGPATPSAVQLAQLEDEIEAFVDQYHGTPLAQLEPGRTCWPR